MVKRGRVLQRQVGTRNSKRASEGKRGRIVRQKQKNYKYESR